MTMKKGGTLYDGISGALTEKAFLRHVNMTEEEMLAFLEENGFREIAEKLEAGTEGGSQRFSLAKTAELAGPALGKLCSPPEEGWLPHTYQYVLGRLFPEKQTIDDETAAKHGRGRFVVLQIVRALHEYEEANMPFDPTLDMNFLSYEEITGEGYNQEYLRFTRLLRQHYIYEFMRIGTEITPFNTLGHIAGVHYVAMHGAYQLRALGVPVDLGLVSGAAAGHDIGKYGCKKSEERRIPYLHYFYTDLCLNRLNMPMIAHIAANHSTWDLELENLSAEALLLIYADFRVKSSRGADGREQVHFYSLKDAFQVILNKLDNVDEAKEKRYRKVYNKLKDFEDYMIDLGVCVDLPETARPVPDKPQIRVKTDTALMTSNQAIKELKYAAVDHNIRIMNLFYREEAFANLLETARSETQWRNLRMYISIFGEYSTYMTEKQKLMTLRFLSELMVHIESDIRSQASEVTGQIVARFNEEYKKEIPDGKKLPAKEITNFTLWENVISDILNPDHRLTEKHKQWKCGCLQGVTAGLMRNCRPELRPEYIDALIEWYKSGELTGYAEEALFRTAQSVKDDWCTDNQISVIRSFEEKSAASYERNNHGPVSEAAMFLENMKAKTPWAVKTANIGIMIQHIRENPSAGQILHVATHLSNLIQVSETVTVRKAAGDALISIFDRLPAEQRNEIAVELGKALEIGDYQFTTYIPQYLGIIMLYLKPGELDELILDLKKLFEQSGPQVAGAVLRTFGALIENYRIYRDNFGCEECEEVSEGRKFRVLRMLLHGFASYKVEISQEALWTIGGLFASDKLDTEEKYRILAHCGKKILTLHHTHGGNKLDFFYNAAVLNHVYRFICECELERGPADIEDRKKVAFFPGTFDPFSLSHKAIAQEIRNLGYEVYLALDEFSWSKKTQPRLHRRKILEMSVADEENIYLFPDHIPVNIANPQDLINLREIFEGRELFFVAGSDVIENASCYRAIPQEGSIHSMNHIIFRRKSDARRNAVSQAGPYPVTGRIINLQLEEFFEDISSTRIRENIDSGRDISNLIDPVAQSYISDYSLYLREPAYKHILQAKDISLESFGHNGSGVISDMQEELIKMGCDISAICGYLERGDVLSVAIRDAARADCIVAAAAACPDQSDEHSAVIGGLYFNRVSRISGLGQMILAEILTELLARGCTKVIYRPEGGAGLDERTRKVIEKQGFVINDDGEYEVDMSSPVIVFKNIDTIIKNPLSKNKRVLRAIENAHNKLLAALTDMYPGQLVLSFNSNMMHHKMIQLIARTNKVSAVPYKEKKYGPDMAVPFSSMMESLAVPNTVTKDLYTEKYFSRDVSSFTVEEQSFFSPLDNQVKTIKSFNRPVILVDNLLHKGYRMKELYPLLMKHGIDVINVVVGVSTARGRSLMEGTGCSVDSAYYVPNLKCWIDETAVYPYIGGDSLKDPGKPVKGQDEIPAVNMVLPYAVPTFLGDVSGKGIYSYSMTCLENARDILKTLEEEYQKEFARKLTLKRVGEVISVPKRPESDLNKNYDENIAPSAYVEQDIEKLIRLRKMFI
ncbi:MAG: phosphohydrolase [Firmicutes bacterium]|nr:phosphohydrolase [Bacillota bacterium]